MKFLKQAFYKTLWEDKKMMILVIGAVAALIIVYTVYKVTSYQVSRSWNWNVGGYASRTKATVCEMVQREHLTEKGREICND